MEQNFVATYRRRVDECRWGALPLVAWVIANPVTAAKIAGGVAAVGIAGYHYVTGKW